MKITISFLCIVFIFSICSAKNSYGEYLIKFKNGKRSLFLHTNSFGKHGSFRQSKIKFAEFAVFEPSKNSDIDAVIDKLETLPDVEYVEPNYIIKSTPIEESDPVILNSESTYPNDTYFSSQWGLHNTGNNSGGWWTSGYPGEDINALKAWEIEKGSRDIIVAVIDGGVDYKHPDLKENMWVNDAELNGKEGVDDDENGYIDDIYGYDFSDDDSDPMDTRGHGTHCAGIIGAVQNNRIGGCGVMGDVRLMALRFINSYGEGQIDDAVIAIEYAIEAGAKIISNSWGSYEYLKILKDAITLAKDHNILFIAAAGNDAWDNDSNEPAYPASYKIDNVISVGAFAGSGAAVNFSNYGKKSVHVFAPGKDIFSTYPGGGYKKLSGTSMATPFVAGIAGLLLSHYPDMDYSEVRDRIIKTSVYSSYLAAYSVSRGRVDAYRALMNIRN